MVDLQVDFTGLAIIRLTPAEELSNVLTSLDPKLGRSILALAMSLFNNSSIRRKGDLMLSCGRGGLSIIRYYCRASSCDLVNPHTVAI